MVGNEPSLLLEMNAKSLILRNRKKSGADGFMSGLRENGQSNKLLITGC